MNNVTRMMSSKKLVVDNYLIQVARELELNLIDFLVLGYLLNNYNCLFDVELMSEVLGYSVNEVMESFNNLMVKNLVTLNASKDMEARLSEVVCLDGYYEYVVNHIDKELKEEEKIDVYQIFEQELGRPISSTELEIIDGWLKSGTSEELIIAALKEAIYNGVPRFRYIDQIIYEWEKKGFKKAEDVNDYLKKGKGKEKNKEVSKKEQDILEYDWIND